MEGLIACMGVRRQSILGRSACPDCPVSPPGLPLRPGSAVAVDCRVSYLSPAARSGFRPARHRTRTRNRHTVGKGTSLVHCDRTDVGRKRATNQDSLACLPPSSPAQYRQRGWLFLVADGMGAHAAGERASAIAAERVPLLYAKSAPRSPPLALKRSIEAVNDEIHSSGESTPGLKGMGTTCTALAILPRGALVGHVGDSRCYRVRAGSVEQLTRDHSLVWELEASKPAGSDAVSLGTWPPKNIITRSMGPNADVQVDIEGPFPVEEGDVFLLASDGLSGQVADEEIGLFASQLEPRDAAEALVGLTLIRGAPDNVTLIIAKAGPQEVTDSSKNDPPWPMSDAEPAAEASTPIPWKPLVAAAVSLFGGLAALGGKDAFEPWPPTGIVQSAMLIAAGMLIAAAVVLLLWAILQSLAPAPTRQRVLAPGGRLGKGPYRTYSCSPTPQILEGVVASIEAAGDELSPDARAEAIARLAEARREAAAGRSREALAAVKRALDIHVRAIRR
jgi:serine/threonine protein phosphatase PrpC